MGTETFDHEHTRIIFMSFGGLVPKLDGNSKKAHRRVKRTELWSLVVYVE